MTKYTYYNIYHPNHFSKLNIFIIYYFWLPWVFITGRGLSLVVARGATLCCSARASHCGGFSCWGAQAPGSWASVGVARGLAAL